MSKRSQVWCNTTMGHLFVGFRVNGWQVDFAGGPWRPLSYREGERSGWSLDFGRVGILRAGPLRKLGAEGPS